MNADDEENNNVCVSKLKACVFADWCEWLNKADGEVNVQSTAGEKSRAAISQINEKTTAAGVDQITSSQTREWRWGYQVKRFLDVQTKSTKDLVAVWNQKLMLNTLVVHSYDVICIIIFLGFILAFISI